MTDVLVRGVRDEVLAAIDSHAAALGLSRNEYLRRRLVQDGRRRASPVTGADLRRFEAEFGGLVDPGVMAGAWD